ncbi:hypothetical protein ACFL6C_09140 [Myxococcota bacterium]
MATVDLSKLPWYHWDGDAPRENWQAIAKDFRTQAEAHDKVKVLLTDPGARNDTYIIARANDGTWQVHKRLDLGYVDPVQGDLDKVESRYVVILYSDFFAPNFEQKAQETTTAPIKEKVEIQRPKILDKIPEPELTAAKKMLKGLPALVHKEAAKRGKAPPPNITKASSASFRKQVDLYFAPLFEAHEAGKSDAECKAALRKVLDRIEWTGGPNPKTGKEDPVDPEFLAWIEENEASAQEKEVMTRLLDWVEKHRYYKIPKLPARALKVSMFKYAKKLSGATLECPMGFMNPAILTFLEHLDFSKLLGEKNVERDDEWSDVRGGGKNWSAYLHFFTGIAFSRAPGSEEGLSEEALRELILYYEYYEQEGWVQFGEDAINDLIATDAGRLVGEALRAGKITTEEDLLRVVNESFDTSRAWVGKLLAIRRDDFDAWLMQAERPEKPDWNQWKKYETSLEMLAQGKSTDEVLASPQVQKQIEIARLIYEGQARDDIKITPLQRVIVEQDTQKYLDDADPPTFNPNYMPLVTFVKGDSDEQVDVALENIEKVVKRYMADKPTRIEKAKSVTWDQLEQKLMTLAQNPGTESHKEVWKALAPFMRSQADAIDERKEAGQLPVEVSKLVEKVAAAAFESWSPKGEKQLAPGLQDFLASLAAVRKTLEASRGVRDREKFDRLRAGYWGALSSNWSAWRRHWNPSKVEGRDQRWVEVKADMVAWAAGKTAPVFEQARADKRGGKKQKNERAADLAKTASTELEADYAYQLAKGDQAKAGVIAALIANGSEEGTRLLTEVVRKKDSSLLLAVGRINPNAFALLDDGVLAGLSRLWMSPPSPNAQEKQDTKDFEKITDRAEQLLIERANLMVAGKGKLDIAAVAKVKDSLATRIIEGVSIPEPLKAKGYVAVLCAYHTTVRKGLENLDSEKLAQIYPVTQHDAKAANNEQLAATIRQIVSARVSKLLKGPDPGGLAKLAELSPALVRDLVVMDAGFCGTLMRKIDGWSEGSKRKDFVAAALMVLSSDIPDKTVFTTVIKGHERFGAVLERLKRMKVEGVEDLVKALT